MAKRKAIGKKLRFEIFKRDGFQCQYCGNTPPAVILEVDHIRPVSKGGGNEEDNLLTACFDCNRGKSSEELSSSPQTIEEKRLFLAEKEEQLKEYQKLITAKKRRLTREANKIDKVFREYFPDRELTDTFKQSIKTNFLSAMPVDQVESAMHIACGKMYNSNKATKYFCGICWRCIREGVSLG